MVVYFFLKHHVASEASVIWSIFEHCLIQGMTLVQVLEALTTEKCHEHFSLERLEVLGDAFLKFAVGRHIFLLNNALDEGQLTKKRSKIVCNSNLRKLAIKSGLQVKDYLEWIVK